MSQASLQAFVEPGSAKTYVFPIRAPRARDWIAEVPIFSKLICLNNSPKPLIIFLAISLMTSGVESRPVNPVPPVVIIVSTNLFDDKLKIVFFIT